LWGAFNDTPNRLRGLDASPQRQTTAMSMASLDRTPGLKAQQAFIFLTIEPNGRTQRHSHRRTP
jgi:hypothetical protein